jgi:hypothetical protein
VSYGCPNRKHLEARRSDDTYKLALQAVADDVLENATHLLRDVRDRHAWLSPGFYGPPVHGTNRCQPRNYTVRFSDFVDPVLEIRQLHPSRAACRRACQAKLLCMPVKTSAVKIDWSLSGRKWCMGINRAWGNRGALSWCRGSCSSTMWPSRLLLTFGVRPSAHRVWTSSCPPVWVRRGSTLHERRNASTWECMKSSYGRQKLGFIEFA